MAEKANNSEYWAANIRLVSLCLVIWALCSYGFAILFRPMLSGIAVGGIRENMVVVVDGLAPGDLVASAGVSFLKEGQEVRLLGSED